MKLKKLLYVKGTPQHPLRTQIINLQHEHKLESSCFADKLKTLEDEHNLEKRCFEAKLKKLEDEHEEAFRIQLCLEDKAKLAMAKAQALEEKSM